VATVILKYLGGLVLVVAAYWIVLFLVQPRMMFPAPVAVSIVGAPANAQQIWLESAAGRTEAWFLPPLTPAPTLPPLRLFGHGNGELIDYWPAEFTEPRLWGMAVLLVEYPGYGRSEGSPSEASVGAVFRAAYDWAIENEHVDPARIVGYGRSLGGGAVALVSAERRLAALILESAWTSARRFARRYGAPQLLVRDPFDNVAAVEAFTEPVLVLHGVHDAIIPIDHGRTLAQAGGVPLHELPCGHNDCPRSWPLIKEFLADAGIVR
jgi:fermentation-respiration switch protein FrsA (DUF1100 family)